MRNKCSRSILNVLIQSWHPNSGDQGLAIEQPHKSHNAPVPHPTMHYSEQNCAHFCPEQHFDVYGTGALWGVWIWSIFVNQFLSYFLNDFISSSTPYYVDEDIWNICWALYKWAFFCQAKNKKRYWPCRINGILPWMPSMRKDFNYLHHLNTEKW